MAAADGKWECLEVVNVVIEHLHSEVYLGAIAIAANRISDERHLSLRGAQMRIFVLQFCFLAVVSMARNSGFQIALLAGGPSR
jgi:hypothetical protein